MSVRKGGAGPELPIDKGLLESIALGAVVVGFCIQPLMPVIDPLLFVRGGLAVLAGLVAGSRYMTVEDRTLRYFWAVLALGSFVAAVAMFFLASAYAINDQRANVRRCEAVQLDMLSASPRRHDDADLFQALGCHPRGEGSVYAPRLVEK